MSRQSVSPQAEEDNGNSPPKEEPGIPLDFKNRFRSMEAKAPLKWCNLELIQKWCNLEQIQNNVWWMMFVCCSFTARINNVIKSKYKNDDV